MKLALLRTVCYKCNKNAGLGGKVKTKMDPEYSYAASAVVTSLMSHKKIHEKLIKMYISVNMKTASLNGRSADSDCR